MASPQDGIFVEGCRFHWALEYTRAPASEPRAVAESVRRALTETAEPANVVVAFGSALWGGLGGGPGPTGLCAFESIGEPALIEMAIDPDAIHTRYTLSSLRQRG